MNGVPLATVVDSLSTLITRDNQAIIRSSIPKLLPLIQLLEYFSFTKGDEIKLEVKDQHGVQKNHTIKPAEMNRQNRKTYKPDSIALCLRNENIFFTDYYLPAENMYYLQYNRCWSKELELQYGNPQHAEKMPSFKDFEENVFRILSTDSVEKIVVDVRFNGGGSSPQGTEFAEKLAKFLKGRPNMKVYVILGRHTFSSSILNAMDFKRLTNAVFVGEETSGKPNHFGEIKNFKLPASGVRITYATKYFKRTDENANTITPEIKLEPSFADFTRGIDPAYEWIRNHNQ